MNAPDVTRINLIGSSGCGKTTLGRQIACILNLPFIETDKIFWKNGWNTPPDAEFLSELESALQGDQWVLDGNYTRSIPIKWSRVQMVIWVDLPFYTVFFQSLKRAVQRIISREELWPGSGCYETFRQTFLSRKSILLWMLSQFGKVRRRGEGFMQDSRFAHIQFVRLRSRAEATEFLEKLQRRSTPDVRKE